MRTPWYRKLVVVGAVALTTALAVLAALGARGLPGAPVPPSSEVILSLAPATSYSSLDEPLRLLGEARQHFRDVRDYTCLFTKRERLRGEVQPENVIELKIRSEPFSVNMHWLGPKEFAGQEVCYVAGRYNGRMRAKSAGVLGALGYLTLDPRDERALAHNRHDVTEAGIANLIERFARGWEAERPLNRVRVVLTECDWNERRCTRIEARRAPGDRADSHTYRVVLYLDRQKRLPIRVEVYDWPRADGDSGGELLECYCYNDLRLNVGLGDDVFTR